MLIDRSFVVGLPEFGRSTGLGVRPPFPRPARLEPPRRASGAGGPEWGGRAPPGGGGEAGGGGGGGER
ncbi:hypothetical protein, partial [Nocardia brasiliensis]|uniref:hypothetical protein n=1 Tax=Nocardia brasiliensis TaxID=37326 RepID=UPI002458D8B4